MAWSPPEGGFVKIQIHDPGRFALKNAIRTAIAVPAALAIGLKVFDQPQMGLIGAFGCLGLLVFVDFGGNVKTRLRAYLALWVACVFTISIGTLCSQTTWLAVVVAAVAGFAILFSGVLDSYLAAGSVTATLLFVVSVMVEVPPSELGWRLIGWVMAGLFSVVMVFLVWPKRAPDALRAGAADAIDSVASLIEATGVPGVKEATDRRRAELAQEAMGKIAGVRGAFVSIPRRPSGIGRRTAALGRLVDELDWIGDLAREQPAPLDATLSFGRERFSIEGSVPYVLRAAAGRLRANDAGDEGSELPELMVEHSGIGKAFVDGIPVRRVNQDAGQITAQLNETYRLRSLAYAAYQLGRHAVEASGGTPPPDESAPDEPGALRQGGRIARSHTSMRSVWFRNSLRGAAGMALAVLVAKITDTQNGFWVVLGTIAVLRSNALATGQTVIQALAGTVVGIVVGGLIVAAIGTHTGLLWAVLPFAALLAAYSPRAVSFGAGQAAFTIVILVFFNLLDPVGWTLGVTRIEDVAMGCGVSLVVGILFWPEGATGVVRDSIGTAYRSAADYLDQRIALLVGSQRVDDSEQGAIEARAASLRLDETVREYLAENGSARSHLSSLARLVGGATRVRRVARLMDDTSEIADLLGTEGRAPWVVSACDVFDAEWRDRRNWFEEFGRAVAEGRAAPTAERGAPAVALAPSSRLARFRGPMVVLQDGDSGDGLPPGLAIAWAERHLETLLELEPQLVQASQEVFTAAPDGVGPS
jgi:uncharacterized membrane protein YccC